MKGETMKRDELMERLDRVANKLEGIYVKMEDMRTPEETEEKYIGVKVSVMIGDDITDMTMEEAKKLYHALADVIGESITTQPPFITSPVEPIACGGVNTGNPIPQGTYTTCGTFPDSRAL